MTGNVIHLHRPRPPLADLIAREMGMPVDGLTAADVAALRQAHAAAGLALAKLDEAEQLALFG